MYKIRLKGRLGNQLFIYAFARELVNKYGKKFQFMIVKMKKMICGIHTLIIIL
ncbi:hypothetical protein IMAU50151_01605 [Lactobacillus helveticus]|nr:hypothetical protein [Lactobacillus helveticus]